MINYEEISTERAMQLGKMMASFSDTRQYPVSFNATRFEVICFGYKCNLIIYDNAGCYYKEEVE
jgi:hypothetical protein